MLYEWERVPFGSMYAAIFFQRFMENCLADYRDKFVAPDLGDVLVYSKSLKDLVNHLLQILQRFRGKRIKLKPSKCKLFQKQAMFLGHIITTEGYKVDPSLTKPITKFLGHPPRDIKGFLRLIKILLQTNPKLQFSCATTI